MLESLCLNESGDFSIKDAVQSYDNLKRHVKQLWRQNVFRSNQKRFLHGKMNTASGIIGI